VRIYEYITGFPDRPVEADAQAQGKF
jgi:hypothetical protein